MMTKNFRNIHKTMLHKLNVSCGRPLVGLFLGSLLISFASCHKDAKIDYSAKMNEFYVESRGLIETSADSTQRFTKKFCHFVINHEGSENDNLYQPTVHNIGVASEKFGCEFDSANLIIWIDLNPDWAGTDTIELF